MKRVAVFLLSGLVAVGCAVALAKDAIAKAAIIGAIQAMTGLRAEVQQVRVGLSRTFVHLRGVKVFNPSGFADPLMVDLPELYVDYDPGALLTGRVHLEEVRLNLKELTVVKNAKREFNLHAIPVITSGKAPEPARKGKAHKPLHIDTLQLTIGRVVYKDYSQGPAPYVQTFAVNLDERYHHLTNPQAVASLILVKALAKTTVARLAHVDLGPLKMHAAEALAGALAMATEALGDAAEGGKGLGERTFKAATDSLETTTDVLKEFLSSGQ